MSLALVRWARHGKSDIVSSTASINFKQRFGSTVGTVLGCIILVVLLIRIMRYRRQRVHLVSAQLRGLACFYPK